MADVRPEGVQLPLIQMMLGYKHLFQLLGVLSGSPQPVQGGVLLVPLHPRQAADARPLGHPRQDLEDLLFGHPAPIEDRPSGLGKGPLAGLAWVSLTAPLGLAGLLDISLRIGLALAIVRTGFMGTEITNSSKCRHHHHPSGALPVIQDTLSSRNTQEGNYRSASMRK